MNIIFQEKKLIQPSFLQKLLKINPTENAVIEVNNILCCKKLLDITVEDIQGIAAKYKININKIFNENLLEFYKTYLKHCLIDKKLSKNELAELKHLKLILNLNDIDTQKVFDEVIQEIYKTEVEKVIEDGKIDKKEEEFLTNLENDLQLKKETAFKIYTESAKNLISNFIENAISDQRLTPSEEQELQELSKSLRIDLSFESSTKQMLDKYKLFWQIENGNIPIVDIDIHLQKNENCHFHTTTDLFEQKTVTKKINYSGPTFRVKIVKGIYWRAGSISAQRVTEDIWATIDSGRIILTNKRIIFIGSKHNKTILLKKILDFNVFSNGIEIKKDTGKNQFFQLNNSDIFGVILGKLIMGNM